MSVIARLRGGLHVSRAAEHSNTVGSPPAIDGRAVPAMHPSTEFVGVSTNRCRLVSESYRRKMEAICGMVRFVQCFWNSKSPDAFGDT